MAFDLLFNVDFHPILLLAITQIVVDRTSLPLESYVYPRFVVIKEDQLGTKIRHWLHYNTHLM